MAYKSKSAREREGWTTLSEVVEHVQRVDKCDATAAQKQIREALRDGALSPLRWADRKPTPIIRDGTMAESDDPPGKHEGWLKAKIDWEAGTVLDDFDRVEWAPQKAKRRELQISDIRLKEHWPEPNSKAVRTVKRASESEVHKAVQGYIDDATKSDCRPTKFGCWNWMKLKHEKITREQCYEAFSKKVPEPLGRGRPRNSPKKSPK